MREESLSVPETTGEQMSSLVSPDINMDVLQAFEKGHALLPARPDILLLPSNLKPFVKVRKPQGLVGKGEEEERKLAKEVYRMCGKREEGIAGQYMTAVLKYVREAWWLADASFYRHTLKDRKGQSAMLFFIRSCCGASRR